MTYTKTIWRDQLVERPKTYEFSNNQDGSVTLIESFGNVTELGTPVNATNMNHIENGLADTDVTKYNVSTTYSTGEWVTGTVNNKKGIYASKADNNTGNALTNTTYWEEVDLSPNKAKIDFSNVNDTATSKGASWAMPSNAYDDLTLGAIGSSYTAPANGWFYLRKSKALGDSNQQYLMFWIQGGDPLSDKYAVQVQSTAQNDYCAIIAPVQKGDVCSVSYTFTGTTNYFRFIYAQGSESEAS